MKNPFTVGQVNRNRDGEYTVVEIDGPKMVIWYAGGRLLDTTVATQARIWQNMQYELPIAEEAPRGRIAPKGQPPRERAGFSGLQESDFQHGTAGTSWRARTSLGGLLAQRLSSEAGRRFQSYAIYRRAEVHIAQPERRHDESGLKLRDAKFVFQLDPEGARFGL